MVRQKKLFRTSDDSAPHPDWWQSVSDDRRELWKTFGPALAVAFVGFAAGWFCMAPAPPQEITIAAGRRDGAYYRYCKQYAESLARNGITLNIRETNGSVENYELLMHDDDIDIAIVQGGTSPETGATQRLQSIASVYPEPLWIFCRGDRVFNDIRELKGLRVATGPHGSGTRRMSEQVLQANGLKESERDFQADDRTGFEAAAALGRGELDVAFFVTTADAGYVRELIRTPGVNLLNLNRQHAYTQLYPWLQSFTLARGVVDLRSDLPDQDVLMIAPSANLIASSDLHEAFVPLFLKATQDVHGGGGMFVKPGDFRMGGWSNIR